jgi:hypothetical protein
MSASGNFRRTHPQQKQRADHREVGRRPVGWGVVWFPAFQSA